MPMNIRPALVFLVLTLPATAGTVVTRDGQILRGDLSLSANHIFVRPKGAPAREIPLDQVARADFATAPQAPATYADPREEKRTKRTPLNVFAEYFADREMSHRLLARYESAINTGWETKSPADPAIPPGQCFGRHTARLVPRFTETYTITVESHGPFRLFLDGQLKLDHWDARGHHRKSVTLPLTANRPVAVRLEVAAGEYNYQARLHWKSKSVTNPWIEAESYQPPPDAPPAPRIALTSPDDESHVLSPPRLPLAANVEQQGARVARVDFLHERTVLGSTDRAPYTFDWTSPSPGHYRIVARATSAQGVSADSDPVDLSVADAGQLPKPWGQQTVREKRDPSPDGSATFADGTFTLTKSGGQITENDDALHAVYQPVSGDFELVARFASLSPADETVGPLGGIIIREAMVRSTRFAALVVGPSMTHFARKSDWQKPGVTSREDAPAPAWLKLRRHGTRVRAYTSADGTSWSLFAADKVELPEHVFVGLCAMSRDRNTPAVATFDHVGISPGPPTLVHTVAGALLTSGSFLACEPLGIKDGKLAYNRNGQRAYRPAADIARLVYKPVPSELVESLPPDRTGVLLASGDFVEGDLKDIDYRVTVSNLLFGPRTFTIKNHDVLAIYLKNPDPPTLPYTLTAADGSTYQAQSLRITTDEISFNDPALGPIELPTKDLVQLQHHVFR